MRCCACPTVTVCCKPIWRCLRYPMARMGHTATRPIWTSGGPDTASWVHAHVAAQSTSHAAGCSHGQNPPASCRVAPNLNPPTPRTRDSNLQPTPYLTRVHWQPVALTTTPSHPCRALATIAAFYHNSSDLYTLVSSLGTQILDHMR